MRLRPERRSTLKERVDRSKRKLDDRGKHMTKVVKEKKAIADTSRKLRFPTREGAAEIKNLLKKAAATIHKEFGKQRKKLEKITGESKKTEGIFRKRPEIAIRDAYHAEKAKGQIKEAKNAKNLLARTEKVSKYDARFTNKQRERLKSYRKTTEKKREQLYSQLTNAKLRLSW